MLEHKLQFGLYDASIWMSGNELPLNAQKTKYMLFGTSQRPCSFGNILLEIYSHSLEEIYALKYLRIYLNLDPFSSGE